MVKIIPFKGLRPRPDLVERVAALPYDVSSEDEVKANKINPFSFYHITRSEIDVETGAKINSKEVYEKAKENLNRFIEEGTLIQDQKPCYYAYTITMNGRSQTGLICCSSILDYQNEIIKKHEFTRPNRVQDRVDNIVATKSHNGLVFLAYKQHPTVKHILEYWTQNHASIYDFVAEDGVSHTLWVIDNEQEIDQLTQIFAQEIPATYIADGHHRSAAAWEAAKELNNGLVNENDYYLTCIFPDAEVAIMDYNRVVKDLNGLSKDQFLQALQDKFEISLSIEGVKPQQIHDFGMYFDGKWYKLVAKPGTFNENDIKESLDVSILQNNLLNPILGIGDPRIDERIEFVGGIRGLSYLEKLVDNGSMAVAFSCFPVAMQQLFDIADSGKVMPPKSTWFEPKTRDGLVIHLIENTI